MATATTPDALHFTGNEEADALLAKEPLALLIGFALDQQVPVQTAFSGPLKLKQRFGTLDARKLATADPGKLEQHFREKPAIHRFPGSMAKRVQELAAVVDEEYDGHAERIWTDATDGTELRMRISSLPGFGDMKLKSLSAVLAKRFGQASTSGADDDGATVRRVALAGDPTSAFEPVEDPGDGGGMQPGQSRECAWAHWPFAVDEIEAIDVDIPELEFRTDLVVE